MVCDPTARSRCARSTPGNENLARAVGCRGCHEILRSRQRPLPWHPAKDAKAAFGGVVGGRGCAAGQGSVAARLHGLAVVLAIAWDTQLAPIDVRRLNAAQMTRNGPRVTFAVGRAKTGAAALGTLLPRTQRLLAAYIDGLGAEPMPDAPLLRNRSGGAYSKETLNKDFAKLRAAVLGPTETRKMMDMRRSGAVEAMAGEVDDGALAAKMANTIDQARELQRTYLPVDPVSVARADDARIRGRHRLRQRTKAGEKS